MNQVDDYKRENPLVLGPKGFRSLQTNKDIGIRVGILIRPSLRLFPRSRIFRPDLSFSIIALNINERTKNVKIEFIVQTNFTINYIYTAF
jgi:hypothetical protein